MTEAAEPKATFLQSESKEKEYKSFSETQMAPVIAGMRAEVSLKRTFASRKEKPQCSSSNHPGPDLLLLVVVLLLAVVVVVSLLHMGALLAVHAGFDLLELRLAGKELLSLLVDLALNLDLDLSQLLLLSAELLLLQSDGLGGEILWVHGSITNTR